MFPKDKHPKHDDRFGDFLEVNGAQYFVPEAQNLGPHRNEVGISLLEDKIGIFRGWSFDKVKGGAPKVHAHITILEELHPRED